MTFRGARPHHRPWRGLPRYHPPSGTIPWGNPRYQRGQGRGPREKFNGSTRRRRRRGPLGGRPPSGTNPWGNPRRQRPVIQRRRGARAAKRVDRPHRQRRRGPPGHRPPGGTNPRGNTRRLGAVDQHGRRPRAVPHFNRPRRHDWRRRRRPVHCPPSRTILWGNPQYTPRVRGRSLRPLTRAAELAHMSGVTAPEAATTKHVREDRENGDEVPGV